MSGMLERVEVENRSEDLVGDSWSTADQDSQTV